MCQPKLHGFSGCGFSHGFFEVPSGSTFCWRFQRDLRLFHVNGNAIYNLTHPWLISLLDGGKMRKIFFTKMAWRYVVVAMFGYVGMSFFLWEYHKIPRRSKCSYSDHIRRNFYIRRRNGKKYQAVCAWNGIYHQQYALGLKMGGIYHIAKGDFHEECDDQT